MSLFNELKRRNVIKVAGAYLALAWLVLQLTSIVVPEFGLPAGTMKLVMWLGVIGFPFVVVFSWVYELTPEGLKRESAIDRGQSITPLTGRRLDYAIVVLLVVAIGLFVLQYLRPPVVVPTIATPTITTAPVVQPPAAVSAPSERSIAVLPFADMSEARDQEYFSDGVAEELLNLLAKIPELKVAARTSAFSFKGKDVEIPEIGRRLNVAHVLEGSVRRAGNRLRITVQLIHADDGYHL